MLVADAASCESPPSCGCVSVWDEDLRAAPADQADATAAAEPRSGGYRVLARDRRGHIHSSAAWSPEDVSLRALKRRALEQFESS